MVEGAVQKACLARARWAHHADELAFADVERHVVERARDGGFARAVDLPERRARKVGTLRLSDMPAFDACGGVAVTMVMGIPFSLRFGISPMMRRSRKRSHRRALPQTYGFVRLAAVGADGPCAGGSRFAMAPARISPNPCACGRGGRLARRWCPFPLLRKCAGQGPFFRRPRRLGAAPCPLPCDACGPGFR